MVERRRRNEAGGGAPIRIGTAGWSIPRAVAPSFPGEGSHLHRYARLMNCAEINSSFHRPHAAAVYAKWASSTPEWFRFSVKVPRTITHDAQLKACRPLLDEFLVQVAGLGSRLGPLLVQLPPSLELKPRQARTFFELLRARHQGAVVCEPRHESWFTPAAERLFVDFRVGRVAADPPRAVSAKHPGGWGSAESAHGLVYYRLHGAPRKYWSRYPPERIESWAAEILEWSVKGHEAWCNTASGAALENAVEMLRSASPPRTAGRSGGE
jgi:uncharacterized protein YecE (DUF72 family)